MWIYLNDRFVQDHEAVISVFDHGFLYGDGVFETMRSYGPRLFMRDHHLVRLFQQQHTPVGNGAKEDGHV